MSTGVTPKSRYRLKAVTSSILTLTLLGVLIPTTASFASEPDAGIAGDDWSIQPVAGGYEVTKTLSEPLPMVSDLPVLEVDGEPIGLARESGDGLVLSAVTELDLSDATDVEVSWASGGEKAEPEDQAVTSALEPVAPAASAKTSRLATTADDGSEPGTSRYLEDDYHFGDQAIDLDAIGGIRGEMTGRIYLPTSSGPHPTIILQHGRHTSCSGQPANPLRWPCTETQVKIPSYKGYETLAQTLATRGYAVVSVSANAINANDNQLALDYGAQARGRLILDTLEMLRQANAGEAVEYYDAATEATVGLAAALQVDTESYDRGSAPLSASNPGQSITPADLVGKFDLNNVGVMGHSRGGEGAASAVSLNQAAAEPFGITSVLPLAPVDFGRQNIVDTPALVILPYCDGDVSNQQGQHFNDDSRYSYDDNVLRSTLWVMGANHNFFNDVWTPGKYPLAVSDDWRAVDSVCGATAETTQRLSPDDQYQLGVATMAAWFRLTVGGEEQFLPMFDGSIDPTIETVPQARMWTQATAPHSQRQEIESFTAQSNRIRLGGSATASVCASATGTSLPQTLPPCAVVGNGRGTAALPHWTPVRFSTNVPSSPMARLLWSATSGTSAGYARIIVPAEARDGSGFDRLTFKTAPDEAVQSATDLQVTVFDGAGASWSALVTEINPGAVTRLPASGSTTLNKIVLQQVSIPTATLAATVDLTDIREIRIAGATAPDGSVAGGAYLSDLEWSTSAVGKPVGAGALPTVSVVPTSVEEGSGTWAGAMAVTLSEPLDKPVSVWFALNASNAETAAAGLAVEEVKFAPGQTCQAVEVTINGNNQPGSQPLTSYTAAVSVPQGVIAGANAFGQLTVREDDGLINESLQLAAPVGEQGDVCAEAEARSENQELEVSDTKPAPGATFTINPTGYRAGESVTVSLDDEIVDVVVADESGIAELSWVLEYATSLGAHTVTAVGAGSQRVSVQEFDVLATTVTSLRLVPQAPKLGQPVELLATVTGQDTSGTVTFRDGNTVVGQATVVNGLATLQIADGLATGAHAVSAHFAATPVAAESQSAVLAFDLAKDKTTTVLSLARSSHQYGQATRAQFAVAGAKGGVAQVKVGAKTTNVTLDASGRGSFTIPRDLPRGQHALAVTYAGSGTLASSAVTASFQVTKATPRITVKAPAKGKRNKKVSVKITVTGTAGVAGPNSKVVIRFAGKKVGTFKVPATGKTLTKKVRLTKAGVRKLTVKVTKSANYKAVKSTQKIKVARK